MVSAVWLGYGVSTAHAFPSMRPWIEELRTETNESGFTLGDLFDQAIWAAVRHPLTLAPAGLDHVEQSIRRPPRRGVQFELLTPGDFGATVHFRW